MKKAIIAAALVFSAAAHAGPVEGPVVVPSHKMNSHEGTEELLVTPRGTIITLKNEKLKLSWPCSHLISVYDNAGEVLDKNMERLSDQLKSSPDVLATLLEHFSATTEAYIFANAQCVGKEKAGTAAQHQYIQEQLILAGRNIRKHQDKLQR